MTFAISMGSALRFCAVTCSPRLTSSGFSPCDIGVLTEPGESRVSRTGASKETVIRAHLPGDTQLTLIFWFSLAAVLVRPMTAALLAQYATFPTAPNWPNVLAAETWTLVSAHIAPEPLWVFWWQNLRIHKEANLLCSPHHPSLSAGPSHNRTHPEH